MEQVIFEIQRCVVLEKTIYEFMCPNCKTLLQVEKTLGDEVLFMAEEIECDCGAKIKIVPTQ